MLARLFSLWTHLVLASTGARRVDHRLGSAVLRVYEVGPEQGERWVLLHGLGSTALTWHRVLRAFRRRCRMLVPELSALGGSSLQRSGLGVTEGAQLVLRLLESRFGGRPAGLAGISLGGWMAVRAAQARTDLVERLLLVDSAGYLHQDWRRIESLVRIDDLAGVDRFYDALFVKVPWILRVARPLFLRAYQSEAVRYVLDQTSRDEAFDDEDLARLDLPVGLIWGERDGLFPLSVGRAMHRALRRSRLEVLPGCAHGVHWECAGRLVRAIQTLCFDVPVATAAASMNNG